MEARESSRRQVLATAAAGLAAMCSPSFSAPAPGSAYQTKVLSKKPVAYWRLGETKGETAADLTGNGHVGAYKGSPMLGRAGAIHGDKNTSITLDGKGTYVEVPDHPDFSQPTSGRGLTVEAWMRPDVLEFEGDTADPFIFWIGKGMPKQNEWALRFYSRASKRPNRISGYIFNPDGGLGAGAYFEDKLTVGQWIHIVVCYEPGNAGSSGHRGVHIYRDGVHRQGPPSPGTLYNNADWQIKPAHGAAPLRLGAQNLKHFLTGGLDEIAIYPRVLTSAEIRDNFAAAGHR